MTERLWRDRFEKACDEFGELAAAPDLPSINAVYEAVVAADRLLVVVERLNAELAHHIRVDAATGLIIRDAAASPDHDALVAKRVDDATTALSHRARMLRDLRREMPTPPLDFERIELDRVEFYEDEDPHYRVTINDLGRATTLEESRWESVAAALVRARRLAEDMPVGQSVEVYAFEDEELLPEPIASFPGSGDLPS